MLYQYFTKDIKEAIKDEIKKECLTEIQKRKSQQYTQGQSGRKLLHKLNDTIQGQSVDQIQG